MVVDGDLSPAGLPGLPVTPWSQAPPTRSKPLPHPGKYTRLPTQGRARLRALIKPKDENGAIISLSVLGTTLVIIRDREIARDLLEKDSTRTASRPEVVLAQKLCGWKNAVLCFAHTEAFVESASLRH